MHINSDFIHSSSDEDYNPNSTSSSTDELDFLEQGLTTPQQ